MIEVGEEKRLLLVTLHRITLIIIIVDRGDSIVDRCLKIVQVPLSLGAVSFRTPALLLSSFGGLRVILGRILIRMRQWTDKTIVLAMSQLGERISDLSRRISVILDTIESLLDLEEGVALVTLLQTFLAEDIRVFLSERVDGFETTFRASLAWEAAEVDAGLIVWDVVGLWLLVVVLMMLAVLVLAIFLTLLLTMLALPRLALLVASAQLAEDTAFLCDGFALGDAFRQVLVPGHLETALIFAIWEEVVLVLRLGNVDVFEAIESLIDDIVDSFALAHTCHAGEATESQTQVLLPRLRFSSGFSDSVGRALHLVARTAGSVAGADRGAADLGLVQASLGTGLAWGAAEG